MKPIQKQRLYPHEKNITTKWNIICHLVPEQTRISSISLVEMVLFIYKRNLQLKHEPDVTYFRQLCCSHLAESQ